MDHTMLETICTFSLIKRKVNMIFYHGFPYSFAVTVYSCMCFCACFDTDIPIRLMERERECERATKAVHVPFNLPVTWPAVMWVGSRQPDRRQPVQLEEQVHGAAPLIGSLPEAACSTKLLICAYQLQALSSLPQPSSLCYNKGYKQ